MTNSLTRAPQELTNVDDVIKAYTINGAYVMRQENYTGSIDNGKFADLIVVDQDLFTIVPDSIYKTNVLLTLLAGTEVYVDPSVASTFTCPSIPLGFSFISTNAELNNNNTTNIFWQVSDEENVSKYEVEVSSDALTFNNIATVFKNNSDTKYSIVDMNPPNYGIIYYRVKSIHQDGKYVNSKIVAVKNKVHDELHIYPNPVINDFIIADIIEHSNLEIIDMQSNIVQQINNVSSGHRINVQHLPPGTYTLKLVNRMDSDHYKSTNFIKKN